MATTMWDDFINPRKALKKIIFPLLVRAKNPIRKDGEKVLSERLFVDKKPFSV